MCYPRKNWQAIRLIPLARICGNSMKKSILSALLLAWTITQAAAVSETYEINPKNSSVPNQIVKRRASSSHKPLFWTAMSALTPAQALNRSMESAALCGQRTRRTALQIVRA